MVLAALATRPRKPNNLSRQVARLAASHQISKRRQPNSGPKTATIQYFEAPSSEMPGPNRAASIRRASRNAGQARSGRNRLGEPSGELGRSGAFSPVVRSFMRRFSVDCSSADKLAAAREFVSTNAPPFRSALHELHEFTKSGWGRSVACLDRGLKSGGLHTGVRGATSFLVSDGLTSMNGQAQYSQNPVMLSRNFPVWCYS